ncbi:Nif11-like leader peptide family natural product precursor [Cyanobium sp. Morenito 9A2]|uniref:Nif11-like leader peptide family natural product precursor n=1 Tax=Cyanobium sp. Morenito 9A2 TaxID=2823718 RepID=UPI0020CD132A|nr:Nif11-like leader peptide family natural product precursor [Cyanobium sp. Morenito 9A2]MCP9849748.1 Nif11-like leader peptide family natural product precursor [Cyanobium sp. Morenito 9A2]
MSRASLHAFSALLAADQQLREKVSQAKGPGEVVALAGEHGHAFSQATLLRHQASTMGGAEDDHLERLDTWGDALLHSFGVSDAD